MEQNSYDPRIVAAIDFAMASRKPGQIKGTYEVIFDLLRFVICRSGPMHIVVDGLDECKIGERSNKQERDRALANIIKGLHQAVQGNAAKLMFLSRPSTQVLTMLHLGHHIPSIEVTPKLISGDIKQYCRNGLHSLVAQSLICPKSDSHLEELTELLLFGANGMFLWARLMFSYLRSPILGPPQLAPAIRLRHIQSLRYPDNLDQMYCRILNLMAGAGTYERHLARQVFQWLLFGKSNHLGKLALHDILVASYPREDDLDFASLNADKHNDSQGTTDAFHHSIMVACSSLVEARSTGATARYQFIHTSVAEFFLSRYQSHATGLEPNVFSKFFMCPQETILELTSQCLNYLTQRIPAKPLSGNMLEASDASSVAQCYPFLEYAASYWPVHMCETSKACTHHTYHSKLDELFQSIQHFCHSKLNIMVWVEAMYRLVEPWHILQQPNRFLAWVSAIRKVEQASGKHLPIMQDLEDLSHDLQRLEKEWGDSLRLGSEQIWGDVTAFCDSRFFQQTSAVKVMTVPQRPPSSELHSSKALSTVSCSDRSQSRLGVLSIWSSE